MEPFGNDDVVKVIDITSERVGRISFEDAKGNILTVGDKNNAKI